MKITDAFYAGRDIRLVHGDRWMVYDDIEWVVLVRPYRAKNLRTLYRGDNEEDAIFWLFKE